MVNIPSISFAAMLVAAGLVATGLPTIGTGVLQYHPQYHDLAIVPAADPSALEPYRAEQGVAEDAAITANVKGAIATVVGPGAAEINVETRAAIVTLSGIAPSAGDPCSDSRSGVDRRRRRGCRRQARGQVDGLSRPLRPGPEAASQQQER